jgi:glycerophosphoryl diester phosphodiesterase
VTAPGVLCAGLLAQRLLGKHDINFYLAERPPEFFAAIGIGGLLVTGFAAVVLRLFSGWFLALPLLVFEGVSPRKSLATSWKRLAGRHWIVVTLLGTWITSVFLVTTMSTACVVWVASELVPIASRTLPGAIFAVGLTTLIWACINFVIQLLSATVFSSLLYGVWETYGGRADTSQRMNFESMSGNRPRFHWNAGAFTFVACTSVVVAVLLGSVATARIPFDNTIDIIGHRGAGGVAPENSRAAIERAISAGAQWVEIDVQETADGEVVVIHDSDLMKIAGVDLKVWDATLEEITAVDVGSSFDQKFHDERVPTLREILDLCKGRVGIIIELKSYGHGQMLEQRVIDLVEASGSVDEVQCMSLKAEIVSRLKTMRPQWRVGLLLSLAVGDVRKIEADFLAVNARFATSQMVQKAHEADKLLYAWTLNDPVSVSKMVGRGVDGVITDYPDMARQVLVERATLSFVQRLLVELAETLGVQSRIAQQ